MQALFNWSQSAKCFSSVEKFIIWITPTVELLFFRIRQYNDCVSSFVAPGKFLFTLRN